MPTVVSKKSVWMFVAALVSSVYAAFVSMCMWNWFATRALHVPEISFLEMLGLMWLIRLLTFSGDGDQYQWAMVWAVLEEVVPSDKREAVEKVKREFGDSATLLSFSFAHLFANTTTLVLGFLVHAFLV